jgi:hypothetical protein
VLDPFAISDASQDVLHVVGTLGWNERGNGLADHFVGGIAVDPFRSAVPTGDRSLPRLGDDGIVGTVDDRCQ